MSDVLAPETVAIGLDFDATYRAELSYVWRSLRRLGARDSDIEDLCHETFSVVYRKRLEFDTGRAVRPWLFGIAFRILSDFRRKARHRYEISSEREHADACPHPLDRQDAKQLCDAALATLTEEQGATLIMHDLDGYTAPEIAIALDIPLNTVYSRLRRARTSFAAAAKRLRGAQ